MHLWHFRINAVYNAVHPYFPSVKSGSHLFYNFPLNFYRVVRLQRRSAWVKIAAATPTLLVNSLRQTVLTHRASVHQAAKLVAALFRVARVTADLAESNGSLLLGLWLTSPAGWLPRTGISSGTLRLVIEYGLPLPFLSYSGKYNVLHHVIEKNSHLLCWWVGIREPSWRCGIPSFRTHFL